MDQVFQFIAGISPYARWTIILVLAAIAILLYLREKSLASAISIVLTILIGIGFATPLVPSASQPPSPGVSEPQSNVDSNPGSTSQSPPPSNPTSPTPDASSDEAPGKPAEPSPDFSPEFAQANTYTHYTGIDTLYFTPQIEGMKLTCELPYGDQYVDRAGYLPDAQSLATIFLIDADTDTVVFRQSVPFGTEAACPIPRDGTYYYQVSCPGYESTFSSCFLDFTESGSGTSDPLHILVPLKRQDTSYQRPFRVELMYHDMPLSGHVVGYAKSDLLNQKTTRIWFDQFDAEGALCHARWDASENLFLYPWSFSLDESFDLILEVYDEFGKLLDELVIRQNETTDIFTFKL